MSTDRDLSLRFYALYAMALAAMEHPELSSLAREKSEDALKLYASILSPSSEQQQMYTQLLAFIKN